MRAFLRNHGLSILMLGLFLGFLLGQTLAGRHEYNDEREKHGEPEVDLSAYLGSRRSGANPCRTGSRCSFRATR